MGDQSKDIILSIRGMSKSFGRNRVLDHINLDVRKGTVMGLMGENGAGKSTMMKCLFGTYQKDEGTIYLDGKEVNFSGPKDALENGIAMVHQELNQCLERNDPAILAISWSPYKWPNVSFTYFNWLTSQ